VETENAEAWNLLAQQELAGQIELVSIIAVETSKVVTDKNCPSLAKTGRTWSTIEQFVAERADM
jgi:hypothetical protein